MPEQSELTPNGAASPDENEIDLAALADVLRRRRRLIATVISAVFLGALLLFFVTPKTYRSTTMLQIERQDAGTIAVEDLLGFDGANLAYYETQYSLLASRGLAERVVKELDLGEDATFNPPRSSWFAWSSLPENVDDAVVTGELAESLLEDLSVEPIRRTHLVQLSYVAPTPELAARVANGVADAFMDWGIEKRYRTVGRASSFLGAQIETLKGEIADKEAQLQAYSRRTDIVALDPRSNVTIQSLEALNKDYTEALSTRIANESRYRELMSAPENSIGDILSRTLIAELRADQAKLEREYANKLATYKPEWPTMQELKAQIDEGRQNVEAVIAETVSKAREEARTEYQTALRHERSLSAELSRKKGEAMELNSAAVEYNNLRVEVSTRRNLMDDLLRRQSETMVASRLEGTGESNVIVVDRALTPLRAHRPSLPLNAALGLILGTMFGVGGAFLVEFLDRTIKTPEEVERILGLPLLGSIPDVNTNSSAYGHGGYGTSRKKGRNGNNKKPELRVELLPHIHSRHVVSEAYRSLRTALLLSRADGLKSLVVSSARPGEGKSVTASNLALVLAQLNRKVLLVDADLRKPRLHEIFRVSNRLGLVSYLTGLASLEDVIVATKAPNLQLIPSGPHSPNPAELLSSSRMRELVEQLRGSAFDIAIFDTPPILPVADAIALGAISDGVVLCLRAGIVERAHALGCRDRLRQGDVNIVGVLLNGMKAQHHYGGSYDGPYEEYIASTNKDSAA